MERSSIESGLLDMGFKKLDCKPCRNRKRFEIRVSGDSALNHWFPHVGTTANFAIGEGDRWVLEKSIDFCHSCSSSTKKDALMSRKELQEAGARILLARHCYFDSDLLQCTRRFAISSHHSADSSANLAVR
jgi:hypothetical protein